MTTVSMASTACAPPTALQARVDASGTPLRACRVADARTAHGLVAQGQWLGGISYQPAAAGAPPLLAGVGLRTLSSNGGEIDAWLAGPGITAGRCGDVHWHTDGHWLFGAYDSTEEQAAAGLGDLAYSAYAGIFQALQAARLPNLVRLWNYLPNINREQSGLERYRQFNLGRQQAFLDAQRDAFAGAPAACALGTTDDGAFRVRFLASRAAAVPLENPRQVPAWRYPSEFGPRSPTFSRAVLVPSAPGQLSLLISGTASIVGSASVHPGDVLAQTEETLRNLQAVMGAAHERGTARYALDRMTCTVYVRHAGDLDVVRGCLEATVGVDSIAARRAIYVQADICRGDLLVEIEAHATEPGALA
jgi:chorismate lyase / 3-hydroxybenzoate synthase